MKIAITGGTGFIGSYIIRHLSASGHSFRAWKRRSQPTECENVQWVPGQLGSTDGVSELLQGSDVLVHAALDRPGAGFRGAEGDILEFARCNILGSLQLFEAARAASLSRIVFISTCAVHEQILDDRLLDEQHPMWPTTHYGAHKAAIEEFVHSYGLGMNLPICSLRPCGVYGVARAVEDSKWYSLVRSVTRGETLNCTGGGKVVHAADVARAVELLLRAPAADIMGQSFNCCDRYVSDWDVAQRAKAISGSAAEIVGGPRSPKHQIDTTKLQRLGMEFGGAELLDVTIRQMMGAVAEN